MLLKAYLIDDEDLGLKNLQVQLSRYCHDLIEIVGFSTSPIKARAEIDFLNPDVVFLDINMPGLNGFDFVETFAKRKFQIVFVTAFEEHALHALKIGATDYLIKPIIIDDLRLAIDKVKLQHAAKSINNVVANDSFPLDQKLPLLYHNNYVLTDLADIVLAEADNNYTRFFIKDNDPIIMSKTLKEYETKLTPVGFYRVHKSTLINLKHVKEYSLTDGGYVIMSNKMKIPISRRKMQEFKTLFNRSIP